MAGTPNRRRTVTASAHDQLDYLGHIASESARFADVLAGAAPEARVPTCPDWNADDLLWHLGEVQWFWGSVVTNRFMTTEEAMSGQAGQRPADRAGLTEFFASASQRLSDGLAAVPPETPAWTWSDDHTAGFIRRRQAHEALIHRLDAELTAGSRTAMDPHLSADGADEVLRIMYGGDKPPWGQFTPADGATLRISATDTGKSWFVELGHFAGTDPEDGKTYDQQSIHVTGVDGGESAAATISASAADLDCWLWRRPASGQLERSGDPAVLQGLDSIIAAGIS